ncbi:nitrophorin-2-like [Rhodnius prolixus]|uniref:nitrophorin-2-like n=1 Tax=Rhodnius prolixus TaxID=13249 RepID=UPI003D18D801
MVLLYALILLILCKSLISTTSICKTDILPAQNFDPKKYFKGKWYLTATKFYLGDITDVCEQTSNEISPGGYVTEKTMHYFGEIERFIESVSVTNMEDFNDGLANYNVTMEFKNIDYPDQRFHYKVTVLDTDYTNYSIRYSCVSMKHGDIGNYYIYKRHIDDETIDDKINQLIDQEGLDYSEFIFRKHANCKQHPYF